jgi:hypothetical protein
MFNSFHIPHRSILLKFLLINVVENKHKENSNNAIFSILPSIRHTYAQTISPQYTFSM